MYSYSLMTKNEHALQKKKNKKTLYQDMQLDSETNSPIIQLFDISDFRGGRMVFNGGFFIPPSLIQRYKTPDIMYCVYRTTPSLPEWFDSTIRITSVLDNSINKNKKVEWKPQIKSDVLLVEHGEDPRVLPLTNRHFLITYTDVTDTTNTRALIKGRIILADYDENDFKTAKKLTFDLNASSQNKQKNWNFFIDPFTQHILVIYRVMPFEVYDMGHINQVLFGLSHDFYEKEGHDMECLVRTRLLNRQFWRHPLSDILVLRGGTNPVYISRGIFYLFVHSTTYRMFCLVMEGDPKKNKWSISKVSNRPIVYHNTKQDNGQQVHFPGGAVYDHTTGTFHICMGLQDQHLGYVTVKKKWIDEHLVDV